jgi:hypothetical protein
MAQHPRVKSRIRRIRGIGTPRPQRRMEGLIFPDSRFEVWIIEPPNGEKIPEQSYEGTAGIFVMAPSVA